MSLRHDSLFVHLYMKLSVQYIPCWTYWWWRRTVMKIDTYCSALLIAYLYVMKTTKEIIEAYILRYCYCYWTWPFYCEGHDGEYWGVYKGLCYHDLHIAKYLHESHLKTKRRFSGKRGSTGREKWKTNISSDFVQKLLFKEGQFFQYVISTIRCS